MERHNPIRFVVYVTTREPQPYPGLTESERRSLHHFQYRSAEEIPGPFYSELWARVLLQAAERLPAVRHGVFALSSMHEHYLSNETSHGPLSQFSMQHYSKAIRQAIRLNDHEEAFDTLLLTSVIFQALDCLRGEFEQSLQHTLSGLRMIARGRQPRSTTPSIISDSVLASIDLALMAQVMMSHDRSYVKIHPDLIHGLLSQSHHLITTEDAMQSLQILLGQIMDLSGRAQSIRNDGVSGPPKLSNDLLLKLTAVYGWFCARDEVAHCLTTTTTGGNDKKSQVSILVRIYRSVVKVVLNSVDEISPRTYASELKTTGMLELIEAYIHLDHEWRTRSLLTGTLESSSPIPFFSTALGVIPILFDMATRAQKSWTRREGLRLLRLCGRREGVWDSRIAACVAEEYNAITYKVGG
jgi:hypothetical protein